MKKSLLLFFGVICAACLSRSFLDAEEVKGYDAEQALIQRVRDLFYYNRTSIKTWSGTVNVVKKDFADPSLRQLDYETDYEIVFFCDYLHQRSKYVITPTVCVTFRDGVRIPTTLCKEVKLRKDNVSYVRESFSSMPEVPKDQRTQGGNKFLVGFTFPPFSTVFEPKFESLPFIPPYIDSLLNAWDISETGIQRRRKSGMTEEEIVEQCRTIRENGHPWHRLEKNGNIVTYRNTLNSNSPNILQFDMEKSAYPFHYSRGGKTWQCELEKISGVWVPTSITTSYESSDKTVHQTEMVWTNQKINETIPDDEFTLVSLGLHQGDEGYDYRIDSVFRVEGDEFPPPEKEETPSPPLPLISPWRLVFVIASLLVIGAAAAFASLRKKRNETGKNEPR